MKKWWLIAGSLLVMGCTHEPASQMILFGEQEDGVEPYQTRLIVNPEYLRFDEGDNSATYLLYNRKTRTAYNVNHQNKTVMVLEHKSQTVESPMELKHTVEILDDIQDAPQIKNTKPVHRKLKTNDQLCLDIVTVKGLMPDAVQALKEFQLLLASDSAVTFNNIPADLHEPCSLAMNTFAPTRHLEYGFPIHEWKPGYSRTLLDYNENFTTRPEFFAVPKDYFTYTVQEFREGRVDVENGKVIRDDEPATPQAGKTPPAESSGT